MNERADTPSNQSAGTQNLLEFARSIDTRMGDANFDYERDEPPPELSRLALDASGIEIRSTEDLLGVDYLLESLRCANLRNTDGFRQLKKMARTYLESTPPLLSQPWIASDGTLSDMHRELTDGVFDGVKECSPRTFLH